MRRRPVQYRNRRIIEAGGLVVPRPEHLVLLEDKNRGVATDTASIEPDARLWTQVNVTPSGDASGYIERATGTGTTQRRIYSDMQAEASNHPARLGFRIAKGITDWIRVSNGGVGAVVWLNLVTGAQSGAANCVATIEGAGSAWDIAVTTTTWDTANDAWSIWPADTAGVTSSTATAGDTMFTVWNIYCSQVRAGQWSSQYPARGPVAVQPAIDQQLYYGDGSNGLVGDGVDDFLEFVSGLGAHTTHTWVICAAIPAAATNRRLVSASSPLHFGRYGASGLIAMSDGVSYKEIIGSAGAYGPTVFTVLLDAGAGTCAIRVNGVDQLLTSTGYTPRDLNGTVRLFSSFAGGAFSDANFYGAAFHDLILSPSELAMWEPQIGAFGGVIV